MAVSIKIKLDFQPLLTVLLTIFLDSYEKVPSVCRKCFNPPKGAREAWDFVDRLNEADDKGENGLPVKEWMDGKDYPIPGPYPGPAY